MALKPFDSPPEHVYDPTWTALLSEGGRTNEGAKYTILLMNGTTQAVRKLVAGDNDAQQKIVRDFAAKTNLAPEVIEQGLMQLLHTGEGHLRAREQASASSATDQRYEEDGGSLWLVQTLDNGTVRKQLTNFVAEITADVIEDDGTNETRRYFEITAHHGSTYGSTRVAAREFPTMHWALEILGAKAIVMPGSIIKDHARAAIQELSAAVDSRYVYVHTGWRQIDQQWCYLHGAGAITAQGLRDDIHVALTDGLARYQLPAPPAGDARKAAIEASLKLRDIAPHNSMVPILATAYLAPLRELLPGEAPDFTTWVAGPSGQCKSEYSALALSHFGAFSRLTLPASFGATCNGLERLCHTTKDCLLVIDDFHPAGDRKQAEALQQTAGRLLRGIGNQAGRQRMRQDTSMQAELSPRCVALATGERLPEGHSTNARLFLVTIPKMSDADKQSWAQKLSAAQKTRESLAEAMAGYLQWIAEKWNILKHEIPQQFHALRTAAYQAGSHAREPGQVAYLQLGWWFFSQYALEAGALSDQERITLLADTRAILLSAAQDHQHVLADEATVPRVLALLMDGFASKKIHLRTLDDKAPPQPTLWGWTETLEYDRAVGGNVPTYHARDDTLIGYLDDTHLYCIPEALYAYLVKASRDAGRVWPIDPATLLHELDDAGLIKSQCGSDQKTRRTLNKKICGQAKRCIWFLRDRFISDAPDGDDPPAASAARQGLPPRCATCQGAYTNGPHGWYCPACQADVDLPLEPDDELPF